MTRDKVKKQLAIAMELLDERGRQAEKFPASEQGLPDGTGANGYKTYRDIARNSCDRADREGRVTMAHIFEEEALEVLAEDDQALLRKELIQVAAVCMKWIEEIDRRQAVADFSDSIAHLDPHVTASGGSAATPEDRPPQPPAQQPESRLPPDDDS